MGLLLTTLISSNCKLKRKDCQRIIYKFRRLSRQSFHVDKEVVVTRASNCRESWTSEAPIVRDTWCVCILADPSQRTRRLRNLLTKVISTEPRSSGRKDSEYDLPASLESIDRFARNLPPISSIWVKMLPRVVRFEDSLFRRNPGSALSCFESRS